MSYAPSHFASFSPQADRVINFNGCTDAHADGDTKVDLMLLKVCHACYVLGVMYLTVQPKALRRCACDVWEDVCSHTTRIPAQSRLYRPNKSVIESSVSNFGCVHCVFVRITRFTVYSPRTYTA